MHAGEGLVHADYFTCPARSRVDICVQKLSMQVMAVQCWPGMCQTLCVCIVSQDVPKAGTYGPQVAMCLHTAALSRLAPAGCHCAPWVPGRACSHLFVIVLIGIKWVSPSFGTKIVQSL